jgi:hypothetical protein
MLLLLLLQAGYNHKRLLPLQRPARMDSFQTTRKFKGNNIEQHLLVTASIAVNFVANNFSSAIIDCSAFEDPFRCGKCR